MLYHPETFVFLLLVLITVRGWAKASVYDQELEQLESV
jgi:hypothetical protein